MPSFSFALFFGVVAACTSGTGATTIRATDYNRTCTADADCVLVADGDVCDCSCFGTAAINRADQPRFNADYDDLRTHCSDRCGGASCTGPRPAAVCSNGTCALREGVTDAATGPD